MRHWQRIWRYQESTWDSEHDQLLEMWIPGHYTRDCTSIAIFGEGESGEKDWTWNAQLRDEQQPQPEPGSTIGGLTHRTLTCIPQSGARRKPCEIAQENHWKTWVTSILVLKGHLGHTFAKTTVAPVQNNLLSVVISVDTGHEVTFNKDQSYVWHPGTGRRQHFRTVRGTYEMDGFRTGAVCDGQAAWRCLPRWDQGMKTMWRQQVVGRRVSETQWHENRKSEGKRFLQLS